MHFHVASPRKFFEKAPPVNRTTGPSYTQDNAEFRRFAAHSGLPPSPCSKIGLRWCFCSEFRTRNLRPWNLAQYNLNNAVNLSPAVTSPWDKSATPNPHPKPPSWMKQARNSSESAKGFG